MISKEIEKLILAGKTAEAFSRLQRTTDCSIGEAIRIMKKWKKDRADKIGRK